MTYESNNNIATKEQVEKEEEPSSQQQDQQLFEEDNPCWGSLDKNDLIYLLSLLDKSHAILYENENYIALDKPPDLRMDGPFRSTVHKLTTFWYPSPKLLEQISKESSHNNGVHHQQQRLIRAVEVLHKHNYLKDNALRPIHQLDYATSGVLLIGRTKKAAAVASDAFAKRQAKKVYLAVVHGHLETNHDHSEWPILDESVVSSIMDSEEQSYKKSKAPKTLRLGGHNTMIGFLPANAAYVKWQSFMKKKKKNSHQDADDKNKDGGETKRPRRETRRKGSKNNITVLEPYEFQQLVEECVSPNIFEKDREFLMTAKWSHVQSSPKLKTTFETLANQYNQKLKDRNDGKHDSTQKRISGNKNTTQLPQLFRVKQEVDRSQQHEEEQDAFYIFAACAQVKGEFRMRIQQPHIKISESSSCATKLEGTASGSSGTPLDFKPALTRCIVLNRGYLNGHPVTKVRLEPRTGRRHQLRLHMVVAGHPIVGDKTYEFKDKNPLNISCRMCLHAQCLTLKLHSIEQIKGNNTSSSSEGNKKNGTIIHTIVAPDPFLEAKHDTSNFGDSPATNDNEQNKTQFVISITGRTAKTGKLA